MLKTNFKDYILPPEGRKYTLVKNADNTVSLKDATAYVQEGDYFGAADVNCIHQLLNNGAYTTAQHELVENVHQLTGQGTHLQFVASSPYKKGESFALNGSAVGACTRGGKPLADGCFAANAPVSCVLHDNCLYFAGEANAAPVLLWENASISSSFAGQTIAADISGYDAVVLIAVYVAASNAKLLPPVWAPIGKSAYIMAATTNMYWREFGVHSSGIDVSNGFFGAQIANNICIPYQIYGVKK